MAQCAEIRVELRSRGSVLGETLPSDARDEKDGQADGAARYAGVLHAASGKWAAGPVCRPKRAPAARMGRASPRRRIRQFLMRAASSPVDVPRIGGRVSGTTYARLQEMLPYDIQIDSGDRFMALGVVVNRSSLSVRAFSRAVFGNSDAPVLMLRFPEETACSASFRHLWYRSQPLRW